DAKLDYNPEDKTVTFKPSSLKLDDADFDVSGSYKNLDPGVIDLTVAGKETDIQTILSLLPASFSKPFERYESQGEVFFDLTLKGVISKTKDPLLSIGFGCKDATLFHPDSKFRLKHTNLEGSFATPSFSRLDEAVLMLRNMEGELNEKKFTANFNLTNFDNPFVTCDFHGAVEAGALLNFIPIEGLSEVAGEVSGDINFEGEIEKLKHKATAQQVKADGSITLLNLTARIGDRHLQLDSLNGSLQFNHNDLGLQNVSGVFEGSDFRLNGNFKNVITFLLFENQPIGIETDLTSRWLDLDRMIAAGFGVEQSGKLKFSISPNLHLNFNCNIGRTRYKRFHATNLRGDLLVRNQVAVSRKLSFESMGGSLVLNGIVDARNPKAIDLVTGFNLKDVMIDSLFFVFENFRQTFIESKHLKGRATADVSLEATWDESLHFYPETLVADVSATIRNGELNDFAPLKALNKYLDDEGLNKLRFADLRNEIHVENKTVFIPEMEIRSNVTSIKLSGRHTFDQQIDYRVVAPLRNNRKINVEEAGGAFEQDNAGRSKIYLKITGTTDNYKVSYDLEAVKKKIAADLKREVKELKDAFRLKGKKKQKELEVDQNDTFDWPDQ
ncbi:MAG: AsmA-like C-terminal region-containing protein, partial [Cyclobacteriaceae bacterium]|nr:AsmA-like C-terminal region-containing protein [Cyclobacteriaceae bacterium]